LESIAKATNVIQRRNACSGEKISHSEQHMSLAWGTGSINFADKLQVDSF
jgi:hypothetical protein